MNMRVKKLSVGAVGKNIRVRVGKSTTVLGVVTHCILAGWRKEKGRHIAQFRVVCECGVKKKERTFLVEQVPTNSGITPTVLGREV
jgi:hypothetical protein